MPRLLSQLLSRVYRSPEPGEDGSTAAAPAADLPPIEPTAEVLEDNDLTKEEFAALPRRDQENLMVDASASDNMTFEAMQAHPANTGAPAAAPAAESAPGSHSQAQPPAAQPPAQGPAQPPAGSPPPAAQPPAAQPPAAAHEPAAPPPPAAQPPAAAAPQEQRQVWKAASDPDNILGLPDVIVPPAPRPTVTQERVNQRDAAKNEIAKLDKQLADGDIETDEYLAAKKPHEALVEEINGDLAADRAAARMHTAHAEQAFDQMAGASFAKAKEAGLDYLAKNDKGEFVNRAALEQLDAAVARFSKAAPFMNPGKSAIWLDRWAITQAHIEVGRAHGIHFEAAAAPPPGAKPPAAPAPVAGTPPAPAAQHRAPPDLSGLPPNLRQAPNAADPTVAAGEFAHLANLSHTDLEAAVARMAPDVLERYLAT